ncbi:MAG TPA: heme ABC exporter ATP-binding protein CcmA, partial [Thermomicrobiaceae bacterium]|nr:heme ABC exporter ATP-binding protein CcmA [Thermomicrobiaceae bacterium]
RRLINVNEVETGLLTREAPAVVSRPSPSEPLVEIRGITKRFGFRGVLRGVSFAVAPHECVAVLGANGAGKTTLLRILATLVRPTSGTIRINGHSLPDRAQAVRHEIGVVSHQTFLYQDLTAAENLRFYARMYDLAEPERRVNEVLDLVGMSDRKEDRIAGFSRGMQQRVAIARSILHRPSLLLLDEADAGLDRAGRLMLDRIVRAQQKLGSVIMTTHDVQGALTLADRVLLLHAGRLVLDTPPELTSLAEIDARLEFA